MRNESKELKKELGELKRRDRKIRERKTEKQCIIDTIKISMAEERRSRKQYKIFANQQPDVALSFQSEYTGNNSHCLLT